MVKEMGIYLAASTKYQARKERKTIYVLEAVIDGVSYTKDGILQTRETYHGAMVKTLKEAANRIHAFVKVYIHTDDSYLISRLKELELMEASGFRNADGTPIAYAEEWKFITERIKDVEVETGGHSFSEWMKWKMEGKDV